MGSITKKTIPDHAKLVYKGKIFQLFQWEQEMYDGSKTIFEKVLRPDTVEIIATVENKIIFLEQEQPYKDPFLSLPGGRVDPDETIIQAAHRELVEETGHDSNNIFLWKDFIDTGAVVWPVHVFIAKNCSKIHDGKPDNGEKIKVRFIEFEEFLLLSENPLFRSKGVQKEQLYFFRLHPDKSEEFKKLLFG